MSVVIYWEHLRKKEWSFVGCLLSAECTRTIGAEGAMWIVVTLFQTACMYFLNGPQGDECSSVYWLFYEPNGSYNLLPSIRKNV